MNGYAHEHVVHRPRLRESKQPASWLQVLGLNHAHHAAALSNKGLECLNWLQNSPLTLLAISKRVRWCHWACTAPADLAQAAGCAAQNSMGNLSRHKNGAA